MLFQEVTFGLHSSYITGNKQLRVLNYYFGHWCLNNESSSVVRSLMCHCRDCLYEINAGKISLSFGNRDYEEPEAHSESVWDGPRQFRSESRCYLLYMHWIITMTCVLTKKLKTIREGKTKFSSVTKMGLKWYSGCEVVKITLRLVKNI